MSSNTRATIPTTTPGGEAGGRPTTGTGAPRARRVRLSRALLCALLVGQQLVFFTPRAEARVDPLTVIKRQIHKVNMLVVLDTSGSMTGVPGNDFNSLSEAGIDCDNGEDCRGWGTPGGCPTVQTMCQPFQGLGCPAGYMPDTTDLISGGSSRNKVKNHDFAVGGGAGPTWAAGANFAPDVNNAGDNKYPGDTSCSVQNVGKSAADKPADIALACNPSATGKSKFDPPNNCLVKQSYFQGDPCMNIPPTAGFLYCNGNSLGRDYRAWQQTVTDLTPGKTYAMWAYISNAINPLRTNYDTPILPTWKFKMDATYLPTPNAGNTPMVLKNESHRTDAWAQKDVWERFQSSFTATATSHTLGLWDFSRGSDGDDGVITQIHVRECVPITNGVCSVTKESCGASKACTPTVNICSGDGSTCTNPGGNCAKQGLCQDTTTPPIWCSDEIDCPQWGDKGKCAALGDPCNGPCPQSKTCSATGETCDESVGCPKNKTKGYCANNPTKSCNNDNTCKDSTCVFPENRCEGQANFCKHPHRPCKDRKSSDPTNVCETRTNNCELPPPVPPVCRADQTDKIKMCQGDLTICTEDKDCPAGDTCGAPTSRAVMAKRVLKGLVEETYGIVNYGFMTFYQSGYFPYFSGARVAGAGYKTTEFFSREKLIAIGCYNGVTAPKNTCVTGGATYTLRAAGNSKYYVPYVDGYTDQDWQGDQAPVKPGYRSGTFEGAYYETTSSLFDGGNANRVTSATYQGRTADIGGMTRLYYTSNPAYYNGGAKPTAEGFEFVDCQTSNTCNPKCGGVWDPNLVPFLDVSDDPAKARENALAISARLEKAKNGGAVVFEATPTGCTLQNTGLSGVSEPERYSAYHYMQKVEANLRQTYGMSDSEAKTCRPNYVLFITDGAANGPGDVGARPSAKEAPEQVCATDPKCDVSVADPVAAGCTCQAINAAFKMQKDLGVRTLVVGFGGDVGQGNGRIINDRIAKHGGTDRDGDGVAPFAYSAIKEAELRTAIRTAIYDAAKGSYSTSPVSVSSGMQQTMGIETGKYVIDTRIDYPSWKGRMVAYDVSGTTPSVAWDAATELEKMDWTKRRVYVKTSAGLKKIVVTSGKVTNGTELYDGGKGLGNTAEEAADIAHWMLGDPKFKNKHLLGAIINSTPIDIGSPGDGDWPGAHEFFEAYKSRPKLTYVGASDGMLHAFFTETATTGGVTYPGGSEAFAFVPQEMLKPITKIFIQGGQDPDPDKHVFGLANSPKAKNVCVANCTTSSATWKTLLVMPNGFGGNKTFVLDVTLKSGIAADPPFTYEWGTGDEGADSNLSKYLGQTISVPAFSFDLDSSRAGYRMVMASGYPMSAGDTKQGRGLVIVEAATGKVKDGPEEITPPPSMCGSDQEYTVLTDVAVARDYARSKDDDHYLRLLSAYAGDTWGNLWRYDGLGALDSKPVLQLGCQQPIHFSPALVQLDRDYMDAHKGEVYLVQVTNSALDLATAKHEPSQMIIAKESADRSNLKFGSVADFGTSGNSIAIPVTDICGQMDGSTCVEKLRADVRPASAPTTLIMKGREGFKILSLWYKPAANGCGRGVSYLAVHDVTATSAKVEQRLAIKVADEPVLGTVVANNTLYVATSNGLVDIGRTAAIRLSPTTTPASAGATARFNKGAWSEIF